MFGIGTPDVSLTAYSSEYVAFLGLDNKSWGLGFQGILQYNGVSIQRDGVSFSRGDIVGCLLDLWHRRLTFFINRVAVTESLYVIYTLHLSSTSNFSPLPSGSFYPMACSTAARSGFRVIFSKSYEVTLQILIFLSLRSPLNNSASLLGLHDFPSVLQVDSFYFA